MKSLYYVYLNNRFKLFLFISSPSLNHFPVTIKEDIFFSFFHDFGFTNSDKWTDNELIEYVL